MSEQTRFPMGLTEESGNRMVTGAGVLFYDVDLTGLVNGMPSADALALVDAWEADNRSLGASTGDPVLNIGNERVPLVTNGLHVNVAGFFDRRTTGGASISVTVQELANLELWKRIMTTTFEDPDDGSLRFGGVVRREHHKHIAYVNMSNSGDLLMWVLLNAIQTADIAATFAEAIGTPANVPTVWTSSLMTLKEMQLGARPIKQFLFPFDSTAVGAAAALAKSKAMIEAAKKKEPEPVARRGVEPKFGDE